MTMAEELHGAAEIHARVMNYAICDPSDVTVEEDHDEMRAVVTVPPDDLLIEMDELESVLKAGLSPSVPLVVEEYDPPPKPLHQIQEAMQALRDRNYEPSSVYASVGLEPMLKRDTNPFEVGEPPTIEGVKLLLDPSLPEGRVVAVAREAVGPMGKLVRLGAIEIVEVENETA